MLGGSISHEIFSLVMFPFVKSITFIRIKEDVVICFCFIFCVEDQNSMVISLAHWIKCCILKCLFPNSYYSTFSDNLYFKNLSSAIHISMWLFTHQSITSPLIHPLSILLLDIFHGSKLFLTLPMIIIRAQSLFQKAHILGRKYTSHSQVLSTNNGPYQFQRP